MQVGGRSSKCPPNDEASCKAASQMMDRILMRASHKVACPILVHTILKAQHAEFKLAVFAYIYIYMILFFIYIYMKFDPPQKKITQRQTRELQKIDILGLEGFGSPSKPRYHHGFRMCVCACGPWPKLLRRQGGFLSWIFREPEFLNDFGHPGDRYRFLTSPNKYEKERKSETETVGFQGPKLVSFKGLCVRSKRKFLKFPPLSSRSNHKV